LLLLIACADVAQLQSVRAASRLGELGTRLALGGSRTSLARSLVFETLALAGLAALLSVPLARALAAGLLWLFPPPATAFTSHFMAGFWEPRILGGVAAGALATGLLAAAYPACRLAQTDVAGLLAGGHRASPDRGSQTFLEAAVLAQVAVTVLLLTATATLAESYALLRGLDVGFRPEGLSYYALSLAPKDYPDHERRAALAEALVESLGGQDGIRSASFTTNLPLASPSANWIARHGCEGRELAPGEVLITADRLVGTGYLELLGVRLLAGRTLSARDTAATEPVAVINQSLADECWPRQDPIGKRVLRGTRAGWLPMTVVGVVADLQEQRVSFRNPHRVWYLPYRQHDFSRDLYLVIRGDAPPAAVRSLVRRLDPHQPVTGPRLVTEHLEEVTGSDRLAAALMGYFAAVGLLLAGFGIHGSMRRFVGQQQRAIGIRMALGAGPRRILAGVLGRGLTLAATGAAIGAACALALQPLGAGFVHATLLGMPARVGATAIAILALAAAVCAAPAQRASRIDPARLLR
jgi:predicted permease